ncbi:MAG: fibronectin type III domain-containing protein [Bacteroidales bacterium]|nr:fibronectin type III domain-containing protein [Bacteroidales bacterium]
MRRFYILILMLSLCLGAFSQEITVRFTGLLNGTDYCRLDSVVITNLTRDWSETMEYPDTINLFGGTVNTCMNIVGNQGLGQNIPNPFDCETHVELVVLQSEEVRMQLLDVTGRVCAEYYGLLDAGMHLFDISAAMPQTYILKAIVGSSQYSIRMVNMGTGCGCSIKYAGFNGIEAKYTSSNEFQAGDNMRYVGYTTIEGEIVESAIVEQIQTVSEDVTLNFSYCFDTYYGTDMQTACDNYIWIDGVTYTESTTEPTFTLANAAGCDSIVTLHLTINHGNVGIDEQTACGSFEWIDGVTYTESTTEPTFTLANAAGCDSIVTLNLTMVCPLTVQTLPATDVSSNSATLNGNVASDANIVHTQGFRYGTSASYLSNVIEVGVSEFGNYTTIINDLTASTIYYYQAYAVNGAGTSDGEVLSFITEATENTGATGTLNGYYWVDLGLPSGTKWATCNVGATYPEAYGDYFAWGETSPKEEYTDETYIYFNGTEYDNYQITKYCNNTYYGYNGFTDNLTTLEASDDAATVNWGSGWRMPTKEEIQELLDNCTIRNDSDGCLFTGTNGNSIFLPAAGAFSYPYDDDNGFNGGFVTYWSNSLYMPDLLDPDSDPGYYPHAAWQLYYNSSFEENPTIESLGSRAIGMPVRAVCVDAHTSAQIPTISTESATDITSTGAILNGNVISDGGADVIERGFYYGTNDIDLTTQIFDNNTGDGSFSASITGLSPNTNYYYKAYATNSEGTAFGNIETFTTLVNCSESYGTDMKTACESYEWIDGVTYTESTNEPTFTLPNVAGCDSIVTLHLTINHGTVGIDEQTACESYTWIDGVTYTESTNEPTFTLTNADGCDSVVTLHLTINRSNTGIDEHTACDSYTWIDGVTYTESTNEPTITLTNVAGCDSVVTLHLTINHSNIGIDEHTACDSYTWIDGVTYTESTNEPTFTLTNVAGCDSVVTLHLTINHSNTGIDEHSACDSYTWIDGVTYTESTSEPTFMLTNAAGCDSIVTLHLTIACLPTVQTLPATNIGSRWFTLHGNVISDGGESLIERGFYYGTSENNLSTKIRCSGVSIGDFAAVFANELYVAGTTKYFKAYATNSVGTSYGEVLSFMLPYEIPTVTTGEVLYVTATTAELSGNVFYDGGTDIIERGFYYGTSQDNLFENIRSSIGVGTFTEVITNLTASTTYYYQAYAMNSEGINYGEVMSFDTEASEIIEYPDEPGTLNGHSWVDLGLPSGTKWATCNLGATSPEDYGDYFAWGETAPKEEYTEETYIYFNGTVDDNYQITKYCNNADNGYNGFTDNLTTLEASDDAATVNWGSGWRMPTKEEMQELLDNCTIHNDSDGCLFTGPNGNSIFLPAAGAYSYPYGDDNGYNGGFVTYWSNSLYMPNLLDPDSDPGYYPHAAWQLYYDSHFGDVPTIESLGTRAIGMPVRAVCGSNN